ncbi:MAG TPA: 3-oxoacyl-ACP reductase [Parvularcula sp.]|nr:3-oxoacyl-ACP reductase [Parvularcula sp.]
MEQLLEGKLALVTGAGRGLGRAIAEALSNAGARVIAVARTSSDLDALARESGGRIEPWVEDVTGDGFLARIEQLSALDILVNNAGSNRPEPFVEVSDENLDFLIDLNIRSMFRTARAAARVMVRQESGAIVHMSSQMGHVGSPKRTVYCMTKHAIEGLTKAMAVELAPMGVRVNGVAPTFIETPMTKPMLDNPEFKAFVERMIPMGRMGEPADVANAVLYLASPLSGMVTGHSLLVDGGWTAH